MDYCHTRERLIPLHDYNTGIPREDKNMGIFDKLIGNKNSQLTPESAVVAPAITIIAADECWMSRNCIICRRSFEGTEPLPILAIKDHAR
jgi:hypothetical protein